MSALFTKKVTLLVVEYVLYLKKENIFKEHEERNSGNQVVTKN